MRTGSAAGSARRWKRRSVIALLLGLAFLLSSPSSILAADTTHPVISRISLLPSRFSPNGDHASDTANLRFTVNESSRITVTIRTSAGTLVRTLARSAPISSGSNVVVWDGRTAAGPIAADGAYTVQLYLRDLAGNSATRYPYTLRCYVDTVKPVFSSLSVSPNPFSPNRDGRRDTTAARLSVSEPGYVNVTVSGHGHVRTFRNVVARTHSPYVVWNGRDDSAALVDNGSYGVSVGYRDLAGNAAGVPVRGSSVAVDTVAPVVSAVTMTPSTITPLATVNQTGKVAYSLSETSAFSFSIRNPARVLLKSRSLSSMSPGAHATGWDGKQAVGPSNVVVPNGRYPIRLAFSDAAGNRTTVVRYFVIRSFYLVCVDPGHGGKNGAYDSGAVGPTGLRESVVNFDIAYNRLRVLLSQVPSSTLGTPIRVLMTRVTEYSPWMTLDARPSLANRRGANIFVSIHSNAAATVYANGTETYYGSPARSAALASLIQQKVLARTSLNDRHVKSGPFYVLTHARMPAALHETAFISNPTEERLLRSWSFRQKVAYGIRDGIVQYFRQYP